jgi:hypothetical protein
MIINNRFFSIGIFIFSFLAIACINQSIDQTDFFETLKSNGNKRLVDSIKKTPYDSLHHYLPFFKTLYPDYMIKDTNSLRVWPAFVDSAFVNENLPLMDKILLFSFKKYLNNEPVSLEKVKLEVTESYIRNKEKFTHIETINKKKLAEMISTNDKNTRIGDTLIFTFRLKRKKGNLIIDYNSYPGSLVIADADDKLVMSAVVLEKFHNRDNSGFTDTPLSHPLNMFYKIKILEMNHEKVGFNSYKFISKNDSTDLLLSLYGRPWDVR